MFFGLGTRFRISFVQQTVSVARLNRWSGTAALDYSLWLAFATALGVRSWAIFCSENVGDATGDRKL